LSRKSFPRNSLEIKKILQSKKWDSWRFRTHDWKKTTSQLQFRQFHWQFKKYIEKKLFAPRIYRKAIKFSKKILEFSSRFSQSKFHQKKSQTFPHFFSQNPNKRSQLFLVFRLSDHFQIKITRNIFKRYSTLIDQFVQIFNWFFGPLISYSQFQT
jgi:hypothetical protein